MRRSLRNADDLEVLNSLMSDLKDRPPSREWVYDIQALLGIRIPRYLQELARRRDDHKLITQIIHAMEKCDHCFNQLVRLKGEAFLSQWRKYEEEIDSDAEDCPSHCDR